MVEDNRPINLFSKQKLTLFITKCIDLVIWSNMLILNLIRYYCFMHCAIQLQCSNLTHKEKSQLVSHIQHTRFIGAPQLDKTMGSV